MTYLIGLDWDARDTDQAYTVKSALEIPAWRERLRNIHSWYQKGYINPDAAVTESMPRSQAGPVQSGQGWFGAETIWSNAAQKPMYIASYDGPDLSTSDPDVVIPLMLSRMKEAGLDKVPGEIQRQLDLFPEQDL